MFIIIQVLLVTGGFTYPMDNNSPLWNSGYALDSTELLLPSATSWTYSAALPSPRYYLRGATLDNKVIMTGTNMDTLIRYVSLYTNYYHFLKFIYAYLITFYVVTNFTHRRL